MDKNLLCLQHLNLYLQMNNTDFSYNKQNCFAEANLLQLMNSSCLTLQWGHIFYLLYFIWSIEQYLTANSTPKFSEWVYMKDNVRPLLVPEFKNKQILKLQICNRFSENSP